MYKGLYMQNQIYLTIIIYADTQSNSVVFKSWDDKYFPFENKIATSLFCDSLSIH